MTLREAHDIRREALSEMAQMYIQYGKALTDDNVKPYELSDIRDHLTHKKDMHKRAMENVAALCLYQSKIRGNSRNRIKGNRFIDE